MSLHFGTNRDPCIIARMSEWRRKALNYVSDSQIAHASQWKTLYEGFEQLAATAESLVSESNRMLKSEAAAAVVCGHFDVNFGNVMVEFSKSGQAEVHLIDFEWAGPNVAAYDFAKFIVSAYIAIQRNECSVTLDALIQGVELWIGSYLAATSQLCPMGSIPYAAQASDVDPKAVQMFLHDVLLYTPICAAANFFSNLIHAFHANQLHQIPETTGIKLDDGEMSWLAHASSHLEAYYFFRSKSSSKL